MNRIIIACAIFSLAASAVIIDESQAQIVNYKNKNDGAGNYEFSYETTNGITREESGHLVNAGKEDEHIVVEGSYSYTDVNGNLVVIRYTADENGFKVVPPAFLPPQLPSSHSSSLVASLLGK